MTYVELSVENEGQIDVLIKISILDVIHCMDSGVYGPYVAPKFFERHGIKVLGNKEIIDGKYKEQKITNNLSDNLGKSGSKNK